MYVYMICIYVYIIYVIYFVVILHVLHDTMYIQCIANAWQRQEGEAASNGRAQRSILLHTTLPPIQYPPASITTPSHVDEGQRSQRREKRTNPASNVGQGRTLHTQHWSRMVQPRRR